MIRTGFRSTWTAPVKLRDREPPAVVQRVERAGTYSGSTTGPEPKENVCKSAAYENAVRSIGRCMRCGYVCRPQFCHRDEGKGQGIKTDVREGWAGCGPHDNTMGCHFFVGTSGSLPKEERRAEDLRLGAETRAEVRRLGRWPKNVPMWKEEETTA